MVLCFFCFGELNKFGHRIVNFFLIRFCENKMDAKIAKNWYKLRCFFLICPVTKWKYPTSSAQLHFCTIIYCITHINFGLDSQSWSLKEFEFGYWAPLKIKKNYYSNYKIIEKIIVLEIKTSSRYLHIKIKYSLKILAFFLSKNPHFLVP